MNLKKENSFIRIVVLLPVALSVFLIGCFQDKDKDDEAELKPASVIFGTAVDPGYFSEAAYSDTLKNYFSCVVPENHMKWEIIQPAEGGFDFNEADQVVDFAVTNGKKVRGHVLLWHYQLPPWVTGKNFNDLDVVLRNHINTVIGHYKGKIFAWDVANEIIMCSESGLRNRNATNNPSADYSIWSDNNTDDSLIRKAFIYAHAADPDAKLFINDNNNYDGGETVYSGWNKMQADLLYNYVKSWKENDIPVHGVGMQLHIDAEYPPDYTMIENDIIRYGALGLEVHFTEIDVRIKNPADATKTGKQIAVYQKLAELTAKYPQIVTAFVTWGATDRYSWIPSYFSGYGSALLFDDNYNPKGAYTSVAGILGL